MKLKINFTDFWHHFNPRDNFFYNLLSKQYDLTISESPDLIIYSNYGQEHRNYNCLKLFYNGENERVNWNACDFAIGMDLLDDDRYYYLPNWIWYGDITSLTKPKSFTKSFLKSKKGFCNMVVSNPWAKKRIEFFNKISEYKKVDSGGKVHNNIGNPVINKLNFISEYKFTLAFENSSHAGYTTEKLIEPMIASSIPIYWGNPLVKNDFNTKSFINYHDYENEDEFIEKIIYFDQNEGRYLEMLNQPWFVNNRLPDYLREDYLTKYLKTIIDSIGNLQPVSLSFRKKIYFVQDKWNKVLFEVNKFIPVRERFR